MKRWLLIFLLAGQAWAGVVDRVNETTGLAANPTTNVVTMQRGELFRYRVQAIQGTNVLPYTGATGVTGLLYDARLGDVVSRMTGVVNSASAARFTIYDTISPALDLGPHYELRAVVYNSAGELGVVINDPVTIDEGYCSTCKTVIAAGSVGVSDGGVTKLVTSGSVTGSIVDTTLYLTGSASGASSGGMVAIAQWDLSSGGWSNKFDLIPQTYPAFRLLGCLEMNAAAGPTNSYNILFRFNDDTNSRYSRHYQRWTDGLAQSPSLQLSNTIGVLSAIYDAANNVAYVDMTVPCYASEGQWKTYNVSGVAWGGNKVDQFVQPGRYMSTSAITNMTVFHSAMSNFTGGKITLYGLPSL